ncbi:MAG: hypothetical protein M1833_000788 [Piccolia ochrophora]|nr:MAG: hypothetical protein M1833_000788 [Piccolia ochrophora]
MAFTRYGPISGHVRSSSRSRLAAILADWRTTRNHEFFGASRQEGLRLADELQEEPGLKGKLVILNRRRVDLEGPAPVTILGCTLQSYVPLEAVEIVGQKINDFRRIEDWTVADHVGEHALDVKWLEEEITAIRTDEGTCKRRIIVITHHAPSTRDTSRPKDVKNPRSSAFGTDLIGEQNGSCLDDVQLWVFGHTHYCTEFSRGRVRLVSNQRGYVLPRKEDDKEKARRSFKSNVLRRWSNSEKSQDTFDSGKVIRV